MKPPKSRPCALAALIAILGSGTLVNAHAAHRAQNPPPLIQRLLVQSMLLQGRSLVDLSYGHLKIEPGTNALVLSDLKLYPLFGLESDLGCQVSIDQMVVEGPIGLNTISFGWEVTGARFPSICLGPEAADVLTNAGYGNVLIDTASIDVAYSLPDSSARIAVRMAALNAAVLNLDAEFDYLWFTRGLFELADDPNLYGSISQAEFTVEDLGLLRGILPIILDQAGVSDPDIPRLLRTAVLEMLEMDGSQPLTDAEQAFTEQLSAGVSAFWKGQEPLVITVKPVDYVFSNNLFLLSDGDRLGFLRPEVSNLPKALRSIVPPADLAAALADAASLDDAARMRIGTALLKGDGAPRSIEAGVGILLPLAANWSGEASAALARAYQSVGRNDDAYRMALIALASGDRSALAVADELEMLMPLVEIMALQDEVSGAWPGTAGFEAAINAAVADGDGRAIAGHAHAASVGRDLPRSFGNAYMLATLAAATGDQSAARLRDRLDRRFGGDAHWQSAAGAASEKAIAHWIEGGMGDMVLAPASGGGN